MMPLDLTLEGVRAVLLSVTAGPDGVLKASGLRVDVIAGEPGKRYLKDVRAYLLTDDLWVATLGMAPQSAGRHETARAAVEEVCASYGYASPWEGK